LLRGSGRVSAESITKIDRRVRASFGEGDILPGSAGGNKSLRGVFTHLCSVEGRCFCKEEDFAVVRLSLYQPDIQLSF